MILRYNYTVPWYGIPYHGGYETRYEYLYLYIIIQYSIYRYQVRVPPVCIAIGDSQSYETTHVPISTLQYVYSTDLPASCYNFTNACIVNSYHLHIIPWCS